MAEVSFDLQAESRDQFGKGHSRRMRRIENKIPAVIYGAHKNPQSVTLDHNEVLKALDHEAFYSHILTISVDGKRKEKVILKDLQRHVYKPKILHMDFQRVSSKEAIKMKVPVHLLGAEDAPGVKDDGGIMSHNMTEIEISCLPADLPEYIEVDVANLNIGDAIHLSEITVPEGVSIVELMHGEGHDHAIVSVQDKPKAEPTQEELDAAAAEAEGEEVEAKAEGDDAEATDSEEENKE